MIIPADHLGKLTSAREASAYKKALGLKNSVENLAGNLERIDDRYGDLSDQEAGHVTVDNYQIALSTITGDCRFDPSSGQIRSLDAKVDSVDGFTTRKTQYHLENTSDKALYKTSSRGVTNQLLIDKKSGDWNITSSFLGIPTG